MTMNLKNPLLYTPIKFGLFGALLIIILYIVMFYAGRHPLPVGFADVRFLLLPIFLFFSMKEFRDYYNEKILHFWQAILIGSLVILTIGAIAALFIFTFSEWIDTRFLSQYITIRAQAFEANKEAFMSNQNLTEELFNEQLKLLSQTSAAALALDYLVKTIAIGLFLNIIISVILRRQPKRF